MNPLTSVAAGLIALGMPAEEAELLVAPCAWCGAHHSELTLCARPQKPVTGMSRRSFLFLSGMATVGAMLPASSWPMRHAALDEVPVGLNQFDPAWVDSFLKVHCLPAIQAQLNQLSVLSEWMERDDGDRVAVKIRRGARTVMVGRS